MKRPLLRIAAAWLLAAASVATLAQAQQALYTFPPVTQYDSNLTASDWNPIMAYVSQRSGVLLKPKIGRTLPDSSNYVLAKEVPFAFTHPHLRRQREQLDCKVFGRCPSPALQGQTVVAADSPIAQLSQLKGQELAFVGPESLIVYKVPSGTKPHSA
ncbi:MAG: PhnD/SsuA/transferrin family substrate-binding protein [Betaproteobacteria bacterium]